MLHKESYSVRICSGKTYVVSLLEEKNDVELFPWQQGIQKKCLPIQWKPFSKLSLAHESFGIEVEASSELDTVRMQIFVNIVFCQHLYHRPIHTHTKYCQTHLLCQHKIQFSLYHKVRLNFKMMCLTLAGLYSHNDLA